VCWILSKEIQGKGAEKHKEIKQNRWLIIEIEINTYLLHLDRFINCSCKLFLRGK